MVDVGAGSMWCLIRLGTVFGDTFSMMVKDGRRSMVVGSEGDWCSWGRGMLEADSISFYISLCVSHHCTEVCNRNVFTPLLGWTPQSLTASMTLPFSSETSLTQSVLPVATSICVAQGLTCP